MYDPIAGTDLRPLWNDRRVLRNPHKGWYLHYYDNGLKRYGSVVVQPELGANPIRLSN